MPHLRDGLIVAKVGFILAAAKIQKAARPYDSQRTTKDRAPHPSAFCEEQERTDSPGSFISSSYNPYREQALTKSFFPFESV
ncbi:hypothetical protein GCM10011507_11940 [Edaphobacter acidisoli]|uniref:Uncharacterized protein n=1 Tax=Edaphobacter acidisoli TaxID=2040573 RepID=A0A916RMM0_9BACT|nr:hypothetical protein GCM10011507_11940 [Edaphobacter acidisoli]